MKGQLLNWLKLNEIGEILKNFVSFFKCPYWLNIWKYVWVLR